MFNEDLWDKGIIVFFFFTLRRVLLPFSQRENVRSVKQLDFLQLTTFTASFKAFLTNGVVTIGTGVVGQRLADGAGE